MIVVVTIGVPAGLRGDITRWLVELSPGVYVGKVSGRVREKLWERICEHAGGGGVLMISPARNEQGYAVTSHNYEWSARDFGGVTLMQRPHAGDGPASGLKRPWSNARRRRRGR